MPFLSLGSIQRARRLPRQGLQVKLAPARRPINPGGGDQGAQRDRCAEARFRIICFEATNSIKLAALVVDPLAGFCKCDAADTCRALEAFSLRFDVHDSGAHSACLGAPSPEPLSYRSKASPLAFNALLEGGKDG